MALSKEERIIEVRPEAQAILEKYREAGKLEENFFPVTTYDLVQSGIHGLMVARPYGGSNAKGELISSNGEFCKTEDVKRLFESLRKQDVVKETEKLETEIPDWDTDRDYEGDTVSKFFTVFGANGESEIARFHFPTNTWCWRAGKWEIIGWKR